MDPKDERRKHTCRLSICMYIRNTACLTVQAASRSWCSGRKNWGWTLLPSRITASCMEPLLSIRKPWHKGFIQSLAARSTLRHSHDMNVQRWTVFAIITSSCLRRMKSATVISFALYPSQISRDIIISHVSIKICFVNTMKESLRCLPVWQGRFRDPSCAGIRSVLTRFLPNMWIYSVETIFF